MRNLENYNGEIELLINERLVKPCINDKLEESFYLVYEENWDYWKYVLKNDGFLNLMECPPQWIPVMKIYGYTDRFFELDEIAYLIEKIHRWRTYAHKAKYIEIDADYEKANQEPVTEVAWKIDFDVSDFDEFFTPHENGYKLIDTIYKGE